MAQFVEQTICWKDTGDIQTITFGIGDFNEVEDQYVFYWVDDLKDLESLKDKNGVEEFYIIKN